jgi:integrase
VRQRKEGTGRLRFLRREEYDRLHKVVAGRFPELLAEFVVSVHTGMRLSEQYSCLWSQVDMGRRTIELTKTKNGSARTVHLNADAMRAIESLKRPYKRHRMRSFRARDRRADSTPDHWFQPCLEDAKISSYVWNSNRAHILLVTCNGWSVDQGDPGTRRPQTIAMSARYSHLCPEHRLSVIDRIATVS